jgi:hypothetical protein
MRKHAGTQAHKHARTHTHRALNPKRNTLPPQPCSGGSVPKTKTEQFVQEIKEHLEDAETMVRDPKTTHQSPEDGEEGTP